MVPGAQRLRAKGLLPPLVASVGRLVIDRVNGLRHAGLSG